MARSKKARKKKPLLARNGMPAGNYPAPKSIGPGLHLLTDELGGHVYGKKVGQGTHAPQGQTKKDGSHRSSRHRSK